MADQGPEETRPPSRVVVIGEEYCTKLQPTEFTVKKHMTKCQTNAVFEVLDHDQNLLLKVEGSNVRIHKTYLARDSDESPLFTLHEGRISDRHRWEVYEGDSTDVNDFMFKVQRTRHLSVKPTLEVCLRGSANDEEAQFHISREEMTSHTAYMYEGTTRVIAQIDHSSTWRSVVQAKDTLKVRVAEGVDYAFVMAVVVIMVHGYCS